MKVAGTVIEKKMLAKAGGALASVLTTLITGLLALKDEDIHVAMDGEVCSLSQAQTRSIHAVVALWPNSSCTYDMTLASIMDS